MTLGEWMGSRTPAPPPALAARLDVLLAGDREAPAAEVFDRCMAAAVRLLAELMGSGAPSRESALDLLAADALVTFAFEAASDQPERLDMRARDAVDRIATLVRDEEAA